LFLVFILFLYIYFIPVSASEPWCFIILVHVICLTFVSRHVYFDNKIQFNSIISQPRIKITPASCGFRYAGQSLWDSHTPYLRSIDTITTLFIHSCLGAFISFFQFFQLQEISALSFARNWKKTAMFSYICRLDLSISCLARPRPLQFCLGLCLGLNLNLVKTASPTPLMIMKKNLVITGDICLEKAAQNKS